VLVISGFDVVSGATGMERIARLGDDEMPADIVSTSRCRAWTE
jgi:hypothetical protein